MMITEHVSMDQWISIAKICGKLHLGVLRVLRADEAADKPDDDHVLINGDRHRRARLPNRYCLAVRDA